MLRPQLSAISPPRNVLIFFFRISRSTNTSMMSEDTSSQRALLLNMWGRMTMYH